MRAPGHRAWLCALLALLASRQAAASASACEESGYCSVGVSKHWVGDIRTGAQFRSLLEAVAYKKELIISIFQLSSADQLWADQALQLHSELESMGYAHHLYVTNEKGSCDQLNSYAPISCVWDSTYFPGSILAHEEALWHNRWKFMARATRMGYNVMSIDTDFIFFRDPYYHFKRPPFSDVQLMGVPEGGSVYNHNGGFMYVQNAKPDGPVTWAFKQVVMSTLRRADDGYEYMKHWTGGNRNCLTFDQAIINDALASAAVGHIIFPRAFDSCKRMSGKTFKNRAGGELNGDAVARNIDGLIGQRHRIKVEHASPEAKFLESIRIQSLPDFDTKMECGVMTVPNLNRGYPEELGGRFAPEAPGNFSQGFTAQLKDDCPECRWWPERRPVPAGDDPLVMMLGAQLNAPQLNNSNYQLFYDKDVPTERHCLMPNWMASSLGNTRRGWVLGTKSPIQGPMILGHVHAWHMQEYRGHKLMVRKVYGRYNWTLGSKVARRAGHASPYSFPREATHVLALSPRIDLSRTRSWNELSSILTGLFQAAFLSHRVAVIPNLPCETAWLHEVYILARPEQAAKECFAPTFWQDPYRYPIPVTLAVDERGELVGSWARRLRQLYKFGRTFEQPVLSPSVIWEPQHGDTAQPTTSTGGMGAGAGRRHSRRLHGGQQEVPEDFWQRQRYVLAMPGLWDPSCTRDMHALFPPEFFHWLKHTKAGRAADPTPTKDNTVFSVSPQDASTQAALSLKPIQEQANSTTVPRGSVLPTSQDPGWSWYDVQAAVSAADVIHTLTKVEDVPLVYLDHPVMVVHDVRDAAAQKQWLQKDGEMTSPGRSDVLRRQQSRGRTTTKPVTADEALSAVNYHLRMSKCKGVWTQAETHQGTLVDLSYGIRSAVNQDGTLTTPVPPSQARKQERRARTFKRKAHNHLRKAHTS